MYFVDTNVQLSLGFIKPDTVNPWTFLVAQDGCTYSQPRNCMKANRIRIPGSFNPGNQPNVLIGNGAGSAKVFCSVWKFCHLLWLTVSIRPLLGKVIVSRLLKEFSVFYGARSFGTVLTGACHLSLSWSVSIQSIPSHSVPLSDGALLPMPLDFRKSFAFWKVPRLRPFVLLVRATCRWRWVWSIDGKTVTGENRSTRRIACLPATLSFTNFTWPDLESKVDYFLKMQLNSIK